MASYNVRQRDPLLDQNTQAMLEKRGREMLGVGLLGLALLFTIMFTTYSADDPGWMVATDAPVSNWLGRFGAAIASTLFIIGGKGVWLIPIILFIWGLRFVLHIGQDRAMSRVVFAVIAVALASIYASTHVPGPDWPHPAIGLGGLFGDTILGAFLAFLPIGAGAGLKLLSLGFGVSLLAMTLYVTGFDLAELRRIGRFLVHGSTVAYAHLISLAGRSANTTMRAATALQNRTRQHHLAQDPVMDGYYDTEDMQPAPLRAGSRVVQPSLRAGRVDDLAPVLEEDNPPPRERSGLLARMPQLIRRAAPASMTVSESQAEQAAADLAPEDRIKARINDVIRARVRQNTSPGQGQVQPSITRREPPLNRRGPQPLIAQRSQAGTALRAEPPVVAPIESGLATLARATGALRMPPQLPEEPPQPEAELIEDRHHFAAPDLDEDGYGEMDPAPEWIDPEVHEYGTSEPEIVTVSPPARAAAPETRRIVQPATAKPPAPSRQAMAEAQPDLQFEDNTPEYELPPLNLLASPDSVQRHTLSEEALEENARMLESVLDDYGVKGEITSVRPGPVVTMYELEPAPGLKASRVIGLADDIARSMSALSARVSTVPGRSVIGIELPNAWREKVILREILAARDFGDSNMRLPLALGKDIGGEPMVANLAKMPHLLIAGTTGSGKSVAINTMILSLLYKLTPEECRLIMIDPKMLELSVYDGIPHLLSPVVTDPKKAVVALKWVVGEMEERYRKMSKMGVRNIEGYNGRVREALAKGEMFKRTIQTGFDEDTGEPIFETEEFAPVALPFIVVIVDEMADLMMVAGKEIEACIQRLAQMARASGIHLIMATQRPSVDVITGTIKANFPTRISFQVTSKIDSRTILGEMGAEQLLGMGDMLYMAGGAKITRIHGPFVSDEEVEEIVNHLKSFGPPHYMSGVVEGPDDDKADDIDLVLGLGGNTEGEDALYDQAVAVVAKDRKCSTSYIQRKLGIGYNKAAKLVEQMEENNIVTAANHVGKREILLPES
ncbi:MAG: DNA translocase FtsK 4TM domain-containing protein [Pseudorhodobacter sp.]